MSRTILAAACLSQLLSVSPLLGTEMEVRLTLPLPAHVDLSGRLLHSDNFKDFRSFENGSGDPLRGLFANLHALESRLLGLFARRTVVASRSLLLD